jgi:hypothetical protein
MCWLLVVAAGVVLEGVGLPHQSLLLHPAVVVVAVVEELNYGYLLLPLAPLKQSLWALVVLVALLKQQTTLTVIHRLMETIHRLGLGRLLEVASAATAAQQQRGLVGLVGEAWAKF